MDAIYLREHTEQDAEDVFAMDSDPLVQRFLGGPKTREESRRGLAYAIRNRSKAPFPLKAVVHGECGKVIGYCGMQDLEDFGPEIFFGIHSGYWGRGFARESVRLYLAGLASVPPRVYATLHPDNGASRRVLEKAGFKHCGEIFYKPQQAEHSLYCKDFLSDLQRN